MIKEQLTEKIKQYLKQSNLLKILQLENDAEVSFLAQGEYNMNFILQSKSQKYVFRVNMGSQLAVDNQIKYEYDTLKYLEISGVTPKVYYIDDSFTFFEYGILVMEFLEGIPLNYVNDLHKAATIFSTIHSLPITEPNHFLVEQSIFSDRIDEGKKLLSNVWDSPYVASEVKTFFSKFLEWAIHNQTKEKYFIDEPWLVVNNTEVNSNNFIIGKTHSYLIDWEKPVISDPAQDLTQFLAPTTTLWKTNYLLSESEKDTFLQTYITHLTEEDRNISDRIHLYTPYLYLRALSWCAYAYVEYHNPNKQIKNKDTFEKIKQFLEVNFMKSICSPYF